MKLLPLHGQKTIQICGYPLHGLDTKLLFDIPPNVLISEYGIEVHSSANRTDLPVFVLEKNVVNGPMFIFVQHLHVCVLVLE
jgi:hypothetical protein